MVEHHNDFSWPDYIEMRGDEFEKKFLHQISLGCIDHIHIKKIRP